mgnify:FL=1
MSGLSGDATCEPTELVGRPDATGDRVHDIAGSASRGLARLGLRVTEDAHGLGMDEAGLLWDFVNEAGSTIGGDDMAPGTAGGSLADAPRGTCAA